ncbi:hypothetical protein CLOHYLEM_04416 [[Clostridium] hylemonae DSM 15053]|uniref:Uncharacterized protein n=1 Tax=[Clostridium] hylemonae DSM 15053 TaxID=553973 RepID=C0BX78_9FIRM|nr:hypothetical protein CLOHYLEM_04416 [[Clostridium] hylemonae DSM 15053]
MFIDILLLHNLFRCICIPERRKESRPAADQPSFRRKEYEKKCAGIIPL